MALTDCNLITGYERDCSDSVGGLQTIYITEFQNVPQGNITASSGTITAMSCTSGKKFWTYELDKNSAELVETVKRSQENGTLYYEGKLTINLKKLSAKNQNNINKLAKNLLLIIVKDSNGVYWLLGQTRGADFEDGGTGKTGKAMGDLSGYEISFMSNEPSPMNVVTSSLLATLTV